MSLSLALASIKTTDKYSIRIVYLSVVNLQVQAKVTLKVTNKKNNYMEGSGSATIK